MAMIHVNRGATSLGVFSEEEVREGLRTGRFVPTDIWWREGMANWQPLIYALIGGCLGGIVSVLFSLGLQSVGLFANRHDAFAAMTGMGGSAAFIVLVPLFIIIGLFIGSAIVHLCLMIVGGANHSFE